MDFILSRDYNSSIVDSALVQAKAIPREVALKKVEILWSVLMYMMTTVPN